MAAPVLPYPGMDFTPLDILTAAELDQMVANIEYLSSYAETLEDGTNAKKYMPDYGGTTFFVTTSPWTATSDGFLRITAYDATVTATINTRTVFGAGTTGYVWLPIAKGDIYTPSTADNTKQETRFFPGRWVGD